MLPPLDTDIIVAPATPLGGAVMLIRVSGEGCLNLLSLFFRPASGKAFSLEPRKVYYGLFHDEEVLDQVMVVHFATPKSYTGEEMLEITCHASPYIVTRILEALCRKGARMAKPGEFTFRSFLNGKRDMAEAEAVADLLKVESEAQLRVALSQLRGDFSKGLSQLREELLHFIALLELELDFSEENVEFADRAELLRRADTILGEIRKLVESYQTGRKIRNGVKTTLAGIPNSGKSSLLNLLLGQDRAIVSAIEGTTRDAVSETTEIGGMLFRFIDTAGIRQTEDPIEGMGVERALRSVEEADVVLLLIDATRSSKGMLEKQLAVLPFSKIAGKSLLCVLNKIDLVNEAEKARIEKQIVELLSQVCTPLNPTITLLSAKKGEGLTELKEALLKETGGGTLSPSAIVTNVRHLALLREAESALALVRQGLEKGLSSDLLTIDMYRCVGALGEITGDAITGEEVLHHVFSHFCIGK